jgi:hypothetical protein
VVLVLLAVFVIGAMVLALALDGGGADAKMTDLFSKIFEMFSLGITFALVVLAINAFRLQADLERMRTMSEVQIAKLVDKEERLDQMLAMIPKTLHAVQEVLMDLEDRTSPEESISDQLEEDEKADKIARARERNTLPIYWRSKAISLIMAQTPSEKVDHCRDIIGTMEGADTDIVDADRDILDIVSEALSEVVGTSGHDLSKEQSVRLADVKRNAHALQGTAWKIESGLRPAEPGA